MKRALMAAVLSALVTAAALATIGFGASSKSGSTGKSSGSSSKSSTTSGPPPTMKEALADAEKRRAAQQATLAKSLGVTTEKLEAAQDAVKKKNLDAAVKANKLTAAQRDAILACDEAPLTCDRSNLPAFGFGGRGGFGHHHGLRFGLAGSDYVKDLAAELGVSEDKVEDALEANRPERGAFRGGHKGHGGKGGPGFGPPPGMDGASGPVVTEQAPATSA